MPANKSMNFNFLILSLILTPLKGFCYNHKLMLGSNKKNRETLKPEVIKRILAECFLPL